MYTFAIRCSTFKRNSINHIHKIFPRPRNRKSLHTYFSQEENRSRSQRNKSFVWRHYCVLLCMLMDNLYCWIMVDFTVGQLTYLS